MKSWTALGVAVFREHRALLWLIGLQIETSWWMCIVADRPLLIGLENAYVGVLAATLIFGVMALATALVRRRRRSLSPVESYREALSSLCSEVLTARWIGSLVIFLVVLPLSLAMFSAARQTIPVIHPFAWDATIEQIGLRLHGGRHMWQWLQPVVGHPTITVLLDGFYHKGWSLLILGAIALVVVSPRSTLRRRYVTASVLLFFGVGTIAALGLSSAGPPYYDHVVKGPDPYAPLFAYLSTVGKATPLLSSGGRDVLWLAYRHKVDAFGLGISAMPSMHVATTTLVACLAFAVGPWLGIIASIATIVMAVASVSLGWHYALDGYVGAFLAVVVWWIAGRIERDVPEVATAPIADLEPTPTWIPPSRRRAGKLPEGVAAVASAGDKPGWAGDLAHCKTMRVNREHRSI